MSQNMVSPVAPVGFIDPGRAGVATTGFQGLAQILLSNTTLDAVLLASPFSFTQGRIDSMTIQDKQYAIKSAIDEGTLTLTATLPVAIETADDPDDEVHPYGTVWIAATSGNTFQTPGDGNWIQINS